MKTFLLIFISLATATCSFAKSGSIHRTNDLSKKEFQAVIERCENELPKLWKTLNDIKDEGVHVKIGKEQKMGPGKASGTDNIVINARFLLNDLPRYPEDRLVIVILHEFGHIVFNRSTSQKERNRVKHEFFAFSYSMKRAKKMAENGDSGPLKQVITNLKLRSKNGSVKDPHTIAIKELMKTPIWSECVAYLKEQDQ